LRKSLSFASEVSQADMNLIQGLPADLVHSVSTSPCSHVIGPIFALIEEA
jgi:hypothetical protein